jgi:electron transport complex protein RnfG
MLKSPKSLQQPLGAIAVLTALAILATLLVTTVANRNAERIAANQLAWETRLIAEVLPARGWSNEPWRDSVAVIAPAYLGSTQPLPVYRARTDSRVAAVAITAVAVDAYVGPVRMLVGIDAQLRIVAVRVTEHRETPGLGDKIDSSKSDWIEAFRGLGPDSEPSAFSVGRGPGQITPITGATVTSRAVANAVKNAHAFYADNKAAIDAAAAGTILQRD